MNLPRPLLVVVVIIIVLGVLSCGAGVFRGVQEETATPAPMADGPITGQVSPNDIELSGGCAFVNPPTVPPVIDVPATCQMTMHPQTFVPRKLRLVVALAPALVTVSQVIRDKLRSSDPTLRNAGQDIEVSVAGSSQVVVDIACSGCRLVFSS